MTILFSYTGTTKKSVISYPDFKQDGECILRGGYSVIEIIKNPKRWTDDDMQKAFEAGKSTLEKLFKNTLVFSEWLKNYKGQS